MKKRRRRIKVVVDTNVFVGNFLTRSPRSPNRRVVRLWMIERRLVLALSAEIQEEYLRIFEETLNFNDEQLDGWRRRFANLEISRRINLGGRPRMSRDPVDDIFIATAEASKAQFLITNDADLLEIADADKRKLKFQIVTPAGFLNYLDSVS